MAQIIDKIVNVSLNEAISSVTTVDVNTVALCGSVNTEKEDELPAIQEVSSADVDFEGELADMLKVFFGQNTKPNKVVIIPITSNNHVMQTKFDRIKEASEKFAFYHICFNADSTLEGFFKLSAGNNSTVDFETWLNEVHKVAHVQYNAIPKDDGSKERVLKFMEGLKNNNIGRVAIYLQEKGYLNVAIVASRCGLDSARGTFAHKKVQGISEIAKYSADDFDKYIEAGVNIYTEVAGEARLFMGSTCSNTKFIDNVVKDDWIRFNIQSRLYSLLGEANDGYGVNYDDAGIGSVASCVSNVLATASDSLHQYIMSGYTVEFKDYNYIKQNSPDDIKKRNLPFVTGTYQRTNAIHTIDQVVLNITL